MCSKTSNVAAFIDAIEIYKECIGTSEDIALSGLPMLLKDTSATWWLGIKQTVPSWHQDVTLLKQTYGPRMPPCLKEKEQYGSIKGLNISYLGAPDPVLNSYLLLCPMLDANFKFKCSCKNSPVSPLLYKASTEMCEKHGTDLLACNTNEDVLKDSKVIIVSPVADENNKNIYKINLEDIEKHSKQWIYFHSFPRSEIASEKLILHKNSRTFMAFENMQYIAAALLANCVKNILF